MKFCCQQFSSN